MIRVHAIGLISWLSVWASMVGGADRHPHVLMICVDDLRPELACFGKEYIASPQIDQLASRGMRFQSHYVQAPTCGASRYALLTGQYGPGGNDALFHRARWLTSGEPTASKSIPSEISVEPSLPEWFRRHGYTTVSVGKVSHHPGGRGGPNWNDDSQPEMPHAWDRHLLPAGDWQHPRGAMHGLAHGQIRETDSAMDVFESAEGPDSIYPDGLIIAESLRQLDVLAEAGQPFLLAVGIIRPHLPFGAPRKYMQPYQDVTLPPIAHPQRPEGKTTWHGSGEFMKYNRWNRDPREDEAFATEVRRHYAACVSFADAQVGRVLQRLEALGLRDETLIVLWGDHGWHLGEHAVWGKHTLFEESLLAPLIISSPGMPTAGQATAAMVETIDVFPTLSQLAGLPLPEHVDGVSLLPILQQPESSGHHAIAYHKNAKTIRTETHRLILHQDGAAELYDHRTAEGETKNVAQQDPETVDRLSAELARRLTKS